ncbi:MAG: biotin--[acetyl-CoA-carboxylase] ligase [Ruminococcaceae bacterium]|nr:biotin--[acetyl-CoA-carboxylase] ligase [Oscillospiraceae bacterium]
MPNTYIPAVFEYELTDSTNTRAREYAADSDSPALPALFIAAEQTAGRGRLGRSFYSPAAVGLYSSLLFEAPQNEDRMLSLTSLAAVAALEEIEERFSIRLGIKWVNDLYLNERKVAGILAESFVHKNRRYIVLGIGINLSTEQFPDEISDKAGSIGLCGIKRDALRELALGIFSRFLSLLEAKDVSKAMQTYRENSIVIGQRISFVKDGEQLQATALDVTDIGALLVRLESGDDLLISTGEISIFLENK